MDIAVTGLVPLPLPGVGRAAQSPAQTQQQSNTPRQQTASENSARNSSREGRPQRSEAVARSGIESRRDVSSTQRALSERESTLAQSDTRQFSVSAAIQAFKENEALIAPEGENRQVSGIIDEFV